MHHQSIHSNKNNPTPKFNTFKIQNQRTHYNIAYYFSNKIQNKKETSKNMSCLNCYFCRCSCRTQTITELIIYPQTKIMGSSRESLLFKEKGFKVKRKQQQHFVGNFDNSQLYNNNTLNQVKSRDTLDTVSKILSVPSTQMLHVKNFSLNINQSECILQQTESLNAQQQTNKQNYNTNCIQSRLQLDTKSQRKTVRFQKTPTQAHLHPNCSLNPNKLKSTIFQSNLLSPSLPSPHTLLSPHSHCHESAITQKNLTAILLQKQNNQLRIELQKLQEKQKQLLDFQLNMKEKNNRELGYLRKYSQQLENCSKNRRKQLEELRMLMGIVAGSGSKMGKGNGGNKGGKISGKSMLGDSVTKN